jgi:hypothetical protein
MAKTTSLVGLDVAELSWVRLLIWLLRHPDPGVAELTRQALLYLEAVSAVPAAHPKARDHAG